MAKAAPALGCRSNPKTRARFGGGSMGSGHRGGSSLGSCKPPGLAGVGDRVQPHTCVLFKACTGARLTLKYCPGWGCGSVTVGYLGKGRSGAFWPPMEKPRGSAAAPHPLCPFICCCNPKLHLLASKYGAKMTILANFPCLRLLHQKVKCQIQ